MIRRAFHLPIAVGVGALVSGVVLAPIAAVALSPSKSAPAAASVSFGPFSATKTVARMHLVSGADVPVDSRSVTVSVNQTIGLRDRQGITVSWKGARPTAGIVPDPNSDKAIQQEYPVVVLQCRGVDSATVPVAQRISPETCWTNSPLERYAQNAGSVDSSSLFPPWRVDRYATPADRVQWVNAIGPSGGCGNSPKFGSVHYIPFIAASGHVYPGGIYGCGGIAPEASNISSLNLPDNATWAATALDGTGKERFDVRTAEDNASLGCSDTVKCSLVVIPIMGISCDTDAVALPPADQPATLGLQPVVDPYCQASGYFKPGELDTNPNSFDDVAVSGQLWWSASNWRNRITVPLTFAPLGNVCDSLGGGTPLYFYGSELMIQATSQWGPSFCTNPKLFTFKHVQTSEPQARNLLRTGNIEAALGSTSPPGGYGGPVVNVPIAITGWAIGFLIDNAAGEPLTTLRLTPRLLAKLLSESYPDVGALQNQVAAFKNNPLNITLDPEFQALNPGIPQSFRNGEAAAALFALSSDSDVMYAITSYLNVDPEARAFLDGTIDPWGMQVNPAYKGIALPVYNWPLLDENKPLDVYQPGVNDCLAANPVPYLPLVASPTTRLTTISLALQYGFSFSLTNCSEPFPPTTLGAKLVTAGRQANGSRFLLGITSTGDAARFGIATASLLTKTDATAVAKFTNAAGRTFVSPNTASITAAVRLFQPDETKGIWTLDYAGARSLAGWTGAYPGTMVVSASIPTTGLPAVDAAKYVKWLDLVTTSGQVPGVTSGMLAAGFVPLTVGPAKLANFSAVAGPAILAQAGKVPALLASPPTPTPTPTPSPSTSTAQPTATASPTPTKSVAPSTSPTPTPSSPGLTPADSPGSLRDLLPGAALLAVLLGIASGALTLRVLRSGA